VTSECLEAIRLIKLGPTFYHNPEQKILQHYRFPDIFIRRTKAVYISVVDNQIIELVKSIKSTPTLIGLKKASMRTCTSMRLKYCRKIYASWLHKCGISDSLIDMLQGRIGKNIFLKHYLTPTADFKDQVLSAVEKLRRELTTT
jgi:intergrase/recombinase